MDTAFDRLDAGAWVALEGAFEALRAEGLPCGAAIVDAAGALLARGRNHVYDPATGRETLERTPLAHAEMNALARIPSEADLSGATLWSTQQPCSMCIAAISFCGVGTTRYLAADPAFVAKDDARAGVVSDPTLGHPELTAWAILSNALFLQPAIRLGNEGRLAVNHEVEPETVIAAQLVAANPSDELRDLVDALWSRLVSLADQRRARLGLADA